MFEFFKKKGWIIFIFVSIITISKYYYIYFY